jgi:hypothetical protein
MENNNGLDFIKYVRAKTKEDSDVKTGTKVGLVSACLGTLSFWMTSCNNYDLVLFPNRSSNENVEFFLSTAFVAAASFAGGFIAGKLFPKKIDYPLRESDQKFQQAYSSFAELVTNDENYRTIDKFESLKPDYQDALRIECLTEKLNRGDVSDVRQIRNELNSSESKTFAGRLVKRYLKRLPVGQLSQYDALLHEDELVRMAEFYVEERKLSEIEKLAEDSRFSDITRDEVLGKLSEAYIQESNLNAAERIAKDKKVSDNKRVSLLNKIAQVYLDNGNLQKAEDLWKTTTNDGMLKGPLLEAYQVKGDHKKVAELYTL